MQIAIIYANGMKSSPLARSPTGTAKFTLTCDEDACWKAPNSMIDVWNVTCLLRGPLALFVAHHILILIKLHKVNTLYTWY